MIYQNGYNCIFMKCPQEECQSKLSFDVFEQCGFEERYKGFLIEEVIKCGKTYLKCPTTQCGKILKALHEEDNLKFD